MNKNKNGITINPNVEKLNVTISISKLLDIIENGYGTYKYDKANEQRDQKVSTQGAKAFYVATTHGMLTKEITSGDIYDLFNNDADANILEEATDITIKIVFDNTTKTFSIFDGEHRKLMLQGIKNNSISYPTLEEAIKWNIYSPAYHNIYLLYGGKTLDNLPTNLKNKFLAHKILIKVYETSSHEEKAAIFIRDNCGRKVSNNDMLNANNCEYPSWVMMNAVVDSMYDKSYSPTITYRGVDFDNPLLKKEWKTMKDRFGTKRRNSLLNFFIRTIMINDEDIPTTGQNAINSKYLLDTKKYSEKKVRNMIATMAKQLTFTCNLLDIGEAPLTVYTAWAGLSKTLTTVQKKELNNSKIDLNYDIVDWFDDNFTPKKSICVKNFDVMTDTFHNISRIIYAKEKAKELVDKYCI